MNINLAQWFWLIVTIAVLAWYCTITVYVAIRGSFDVKHMLRSLEQKERRGGGLKEDEQRAP
jgi:hypothetical protein